MRKYRADGKLEHYAVLEATIESNDIVKLDSLINNTIKELSTAASESLLIESIELSMLFGRPKCLSVLIDYAHKFNLSLQTNQTEEQLSIVALLSTACQESSKLGDIVDCLLQLHTYDSQLLIEPAGEQFDAPYSQINACVFFAIQVLHAFDREEDEFLITEFKKCPIRPFVVVPTGQPSLIHYSALYGRADLLAFIIEQIKRTCPEELTSVLNHWADFGEESGLASVNPLVCAITSESVDTVGLLLKNNVSLQEKCKIYKRRQLPERKSGRCLDRQRRMMSDAAKTPNEVASAIKDKKARVAIKTLLRKQNDNARMNNLKVPRDSGDGRHHHHHHRRAQKH